MHCKDCTFWTLGGHEDFTTDEVPTQFGSCTQVAWVRSYDRRDPALTWAGVLVEEDEGWGFFTGPLFGCVHFEARSASGEASRLVDG